MPDPTAREGRSLRGASGIASAVLLLLSAAPALRADSGIVGIGPEALGRAGAYTAQADDPVAVYWNPAGSVLATRPRVSLSFGLQPRPDASEGEFGGTDQPFLGGLWVPEPERGTRSKRLLRPHGLLLAAHRPYPRVEYSGTARIADPSGVAQTLAVGLRRDYAEILAGGATTLTEWESSEGKMALALGASIGLGFSDDSWVGSVTTGPSSAGLATDEARSTRAFLPLEIGALGLYAPEKGPRFTLGLCFRLVRMLSNQAPLEFGGGAARPDARDVSPLAPSRELRLGGAVQFGESASLSAEVQWLSFEAPAAFPEAFPGEEIGLRIGGEAVLPLGVKELRLSVRAGLSWNGVERSELPDDSPAGCDVAGASAGVGAVLWDRIHIDFYAGVRVPLEDAVDRQVVGALSAGLSF